MATCQKYWQHSDCFKQASLGYMFKMLPLLHAAVLQTMESRLHGLRLLRLY
jgi:hypothetical protein